MTDHYQIAVLGAGPGGYVAALKAAQMGASVAIIEKHHLGGTCLNYGCIPSKALLSSAELVHQIHQAGQWGVKVDGVSFDWSAIQKHKDKVIRQLRGGVNMLLKARKVVQYPGQGKLEAPGRLSITDDKGKTTEITADKVILATGSVPIRIPGWPSDPNFVCTSDESVHWSTLPGKLLVVGGGVIGCEFACLSNALGVEVTVVEMMDHLLPGLDESLGEGLEKALSVRGVKCHTQVKVEQVQVQDDQVRVALSNGEQLNVDKVLVATGRKPNTRDLGLEAAGIAMSDRGFVQVNDRMETSLAGHYCIGDANGRALLAHAASAQGICAVENALGHDKPFDAPIPGAVYTFPEIGSVGISEQGARDKRLPIALGVFPIGHLGKAMASHHTDGFVKVIRHRESGALLGVHMLGHNATECIAAAGALLHQRVTVEEVAETVFAHPTISEAIKESAEDALGMALHLPPRQVIRLEV